MAALFFDLDGTLLDWHTNDWKPGAIEMLQQLKQEGHQIIFMTMRGHQDLGKEWSIENTLPILEKLGIEYRILFGVPSPRVMFDDSPTYGMHVIDPDWSEGAKLVNWTVHNVKNRTMPGMSGDEHHIRLINTKGITKARFEIDQPGGELQSHCAECGCEVDEETGVATLHITKGMVTLCEECYKVAGNNVR